jgi:hypothetical protein
MQLVSAEKESPLKRYEQIPMLSGVCQYLLLQSWRLRREHMSPPMSACGKLYVQLLRNLCVTNVYNGRISAVL